MGKATIINSRRQAIEERNANLTPAPLDTTPVEVPLEFRKPPTLKEEMQRYVRYEISKIGEESGFSSFEEEDDFDISEEEPDWASEYEMTEMQAEEGYDDLTGREEENERPETGAGDDGGREPGGVQNEDGVSGANGSE